MQGTETSSARTEDTLARMASHPGDDGRRRAALRKLARHALRNLPGTSAMAAADTSAMPSPLSFIVVGSGLPLAKHLLLMAALVAVMLAMFASNPPRIGSVQTGIAFIDTLSSYFPEKEAKPDHVLGVRGYAEPRNLAQVAEWLQPKVEILGQVMTTLTGFAAIAFFIRLLTDIMFAFRQGWRLRREHEVAYAVGANEVHVLRLRGGDVDVTTYPAERVFRTGRGNPPGYRFVDKRGHCIALPLMERVPALDELIAWEQAKAVGTAPAVASA